MSSWDTGPFDNDGAMNFVGKLDQADPERVATRIRGAMASVVESTTYVEAAQMNLAVASACLVAAASGARNAVTSAYVRDWLVAANFPLTPELRALALAVFNRAFQPSANEWFDLWDASGSLDEVRRGLTPFHHAVATPS